MKKIKMTPMVRIGNLRIDKEVMDKLTILAKQHKSTRSELIKEVLKQFAFND